MIEKNHWDIGTEAYKGNLDNKGVQVEIDGEWKTVKDWYIDHTTMMINLVFVEDSEDDPATILPLSAKVKIRFPDHMPPNPIKNKRVMRKLFFIILLIATSFVNAQSLQPIQRDVPNDSLTNLPQKYQIADYYLTFGINPSTGTIDSTSQSIHIYYYLIKYDVNGNPYKLSNKYVKVIRQGTPEFVEWYETFGQFGIMIQQTLDSIPYPPSHEDN